MPHPGNIQARAVAHARRRYSPALPARSNVHAALLADGARAAVTQMTRPPAKNPQATRPGTVSLSRVDSSVGLGLSIVPAVATAPEARLDARARPDGGLE